MQTTTGSNLLALDVGHVRIGVAFADQIARLPRPLKTILMGDSTPSEITNLIQQQEIGTLVVGLPRGLEGQETKQTQYVRDFVAQLEQVVDVPIHLQDEALTSVRAEEELKNSKRRGTQPTVDELAATYILEDFLRDNPVRNVT